MESVVLDYFKHNKEDDFNNAILLYQLSEEVANEYTTRLIETPIKEYLDYICDQLEISDITTSDIFQFSSFEDCTSVLCNKLVQIDNPGLKAKGVGALLLNDEKRRKDEALIKYGENHAKTAKSLGLVFEMYHTFYLSGVGYSFLGLNDDLKNQLLDRLILRSNLVSQLYKTSRLGNVNVREFLYMLSDSTYTRRKSNIIKIVSHLLESKEYDFGSFIDALYF